jgi:cytochrome c biogenesis protein CcmG, thiol:disulfide interchange protein DsbE
MRRLVLWVPLCAFLIFLAIVAKTLFFPAGKAVYSRLIGQPMPEFSLPAAMPDRPGLSAQALRQGRPQIVNIFASWCGPCQTEARQLGELARRGLPVVGIAIRDRQEDLAAFLAEFGDPFSAIGADVDRRVQLNLGSVGVPETFIVDGRGVIRYQHVGPITDGDMPAIVAAYEAAR